MVLTHLSTIEDLTKVVNKDDRFELIEGVLVPMPPVDLDHGSVHSNIFRLLAVYVHHHGLGRIVSEVGFALHRNPDSVLAPDLAFISAARYPESPRGFAEMAPELVIEVISPSNSLGEIERKIAIYLESGVQVTWIVYPRQRKIVVHTPGNPPAVFAEADQISGGELLPRTVDTGLQYLRIDLL